jgi:hypothetical protein
VYYYAIPSASGFMAIGEESFYHSSTRGQRVLSEIWLRQSLQSLPLVADAHG